MYPKKKVRNLWQAVLIQTIRDITKPYGPDSVKYHCQQQGLAWVRSKSTEFQSFFGVCLTLDMDPADTRRRILSLPRVPV